MLSLSGAKNNLKIVTKFLPFCFSPYKYVQLEAIYRGVTFTVLKRESSSLKKSRRSGQGGGGSHKAPLKYATEQETVNDDDR